MTRLPTRLFTLLPCEPSVFGLRMVGYQPYRTNAKDWSGGIWVEVGDQQRLRQTLTALQETMETAEHTELHWTLERLLTDVRGTRTV